MSERVIFYRRGLRYELDLREDRPVLIGSSERAQLHLEDLADSLTLKLTEGQVYYQYGDQVGPLRAGSQMEDMTFYPGAAAFTVYDLLDLREIRISDQPGATIQIQTELSLLLQKEGTSWRLTSLGGTFYRNNVLEDQDQLLLGFGDELSLGAVTIKVYPDEVWLRGIEAPQLPQRQPSRYGFYPDYPDYHRSPRIIYRGSEDKIQITPPGKEPNKPSDELLKLIVPPLLMMGMVVLITLIQPRGIYILATMAMSLASVVFSVRGFVKNRRKYREDLKERIDLYHLYLRGKAEELTRLERDQREGLLYHFPGIEELTQLVAGYDHRIYEKTPLHYDFLAYRLGLGAVNPSYQLTYGQMERSGQKDALEEEGYALYSRHRKLDNLPIPASLNRVPVGYIGPRNLVLEQLQLLVMELATFHSYHDVQLITVLPEEELPDWQWMRWLPHAKLQELNVRGFVYNQRTRDQVLNSLNQILKLRKSQAQEASHQESRLFSPHYVVLITDTSLILDHVIMEFFTENPTNLGCSLVFVEDVLSSLSENIKTVIQIKDRNTGQLVMEEGVLRETDFKLDHFPAGYDKEKIARTLAPLNHLQNLKSSIPDTVTFLEMYGAERFEDLQVLKRWGQNAPYRSLAVPIGLRGKEDLVQLNLHEKAHGPHGLIAGTTGSGKSETLQSYILSLAVNFHPHDVGFLLIDYKGGGMAHLFKKLPHLLGTITNLDGAQSMRALVSINAEIHRRERIFNRYEVNHINQYQKKVKAGEAVEPLPHLFLISDEFAELKANQPDFMKELVSIARVGRSLGIHLILATQKPSGVVDDQIWSNSRFKLALKVADRSDSMEMLHTPDAAEITQTGRAYLQVGNNEVYELFQSAWSGADYQPDKDELGIEDHTIYRVNELGQYEVLNQDLSGLEEIDEIKEVPSELDAIVSHIHELSREIAPVPQPWLPPLRERITLEELEAINTQTEWKKGQRDLDLLLGMADIPQNQAQEVARINLTQDGNVLLYGSPGTGKTTFLQSTALDLARKHSPQDLTLYLLDFGTNGLAPLSKLPHVADTLLLDQTEKVAKFVRIMENELNRRKKLLSEYGVGTISLYRETSGKAEPHLVILLDSFESMKEEAFEPALFKLLMRISREGLSIGVHLVMTAGRQSNLRAILYANFKHQLTLKQNDRGDARDAVGSDPMLDVMEDIKGRALMKRETLNSVQLALPVSGETDIEVINNLRYKVEELTQSWVGALPDEIPMVPDELTQQAFYQAKGIQELLEKECIPMGLDMETVKPIGWDTKQGSFVYVAGRKEEQKLEMVNHILDMSKRMKKSAILLAPIYNRLPEWGEEDVLLSAIGKEELEETILSISAKLDERLSERKFDYVTTVIIYDPSEFVSELDSTVQKELARIIERGPRVGYMPIIITDLSLAKQYDVASKEMRLCKQGLVAMRLNDQQIINIRNKPGTKEPDLEEQEHYIVQDGLAGKVKVFIN